VGADYAVEDTVRSMLKGGELVLPVPGQGSTARRWASLAAWGRANLAVARLAEGHADAVAILTEAGLSPLADPLYGVWAARPGGLGARLATDENGRVVLRGRARFCSGARMLDRALVVAEPEPPGTAPVLVEVDLDRARARPDVESWQAGGMAGSDTLDVEFTDLPVERSVGARVGTPSAQGSSPAVAGWRPCGGAARPACCSGPSRASGRRAGSAHAGPSR
jgi:alkylation response protein AidB-like acyl-CoA dehydrogenase